MSLDTLLVHINFLPDQVNALIALLQDLFRHTASISSFFLYKPSVPVEPEVGL